MTVLMYDLRLKNIPAEVWMGILVLACTILLFTSGVKNVLPASGSVEKKVILIDAGHGGDDPGKIGINQAKEKDINLAITKKVKKCLEKEKITAEFTRKEDKGLGTTGGGSKKTEDMQARVKMINETKPVLTVSIHQNSYEDPEIHGAQVFYYSHSREGEAVAKILQESLQEIDPENHRQAKANETYYLLRRTKVPTVIVECGFLTNPEEAEKLSGEEYQEQVAEAVAKGIAKCLEYLNEYGN